MEPTELCGVFFLEANPRMVWTIAFFAIAMMAGAWWLSRYRKKGRLNKGAVACGAISILLHIALVALLPYTVRPGGGPVSGSPLTAGKDPQRHQATLSAIELVDSASDEGITPQDVLIAPLPVTIPPLDHLITEAPAIQLESMVADAVPPIEVSADVPYELADHDLGTTAAIESILEPWVSELVNNSGAQIDQSAAPSDDSANDTVMADSVDSPAERNAEVTSVFPPVTSVDTQSQSALRGRVLGEVSSEFANRYGSAKQEALRIGGGDQETEAAVAAGLKFLASYQRSDGSWDPQASGAGVERSVLGQHRSGAGARATTGISGLALLSMLGSGSTHYQGEHAQSLLLGLQYLVNIQKSDGSLAADADHFAKTYCHGMATIAICETAALTQDPVAIEAAKGAVGFTLRSQHPSTGGWRYVAGDPGDMSQLGWQAMVLTSARGAGIEVPAETMLRIERFLRSVRAGKTGGLASYKPGESASRTMTAEALAIRLLLGQQIPAEEIAEAESFLLEELPGSGPDNFYYWYYASLALHQLQRPSWVQWNEAMKRRLLELQLPDGSWPTNTVWGGHGGKVYTTAMACLCLEVYYRHLTVDERGVVQTAANSQFMRR